MRVLCTSQDYRPRFGGVATCAFELSRALASQSHEVLVLARETPGGDEFDRSQKSFQTQRRSLPQQSYFAVLMWLPWLAYTFVKFRPHVVVHFLWLPCGLASTLLWPLKRALGIQTVIVVHGVEVVESKATLWKWFRSCFSPVKKIVLRGADRVGAVSHFTQGLLIDRCGVPPERVRVIFNGVDSNEFSREIPSEETRRKHGLEGRRVVLTVARLHRYKNVEAVIRALEHLKDTEWTYVVAGVGPDQSRLEALAADKGISHQVKFLGGVGGPELAALYQLADVFALVTREDWKTPNLEGFGIVFLEAAAAGKPSIGARAGGIPDAVEEGVSGWLVNPEFPDEIAMILARISEQPEIARRMGQSARERVLKKFKWTDVAQRLFEGLS